MPTNQEQTNQSNFIVVMGVSGSGKSSVGQLLAERLGCEFHDGDSFHSDENVALMESGTPLTDAERTPWLNAIREFADLHLEKSAEGSSIVIACSALKHSYRQLLRTSKAETKFVFLNGDFDLILERMKTRKGHYMKAEMLQSQFNDLEPPTEKPDAFDVDIDQPLQAIVDQTIDWLLNP